MAITLANLPEYGGKVGTKPQIFIGEDGPIGAINDITGIKIFVNDNLGIYKKWIFPYDRFIEYGPEDEWWAIRDGFGHWETRYRAEAYQVNVGGEFMLICSPSFEELVKKYVEKK